MTFRHDCTRCEPLGEHIDKEGTHDLYLCRDNTYGWHTLVARFGDEGHEYRSFSVDENVLAMFKKRPEYVLNEAYKRARAMGVQFKGDAS